MLALLPCVCRPVASCGRVPFSVSLFWVSAGVVVPINQSEGYLSGNRPAPLLLVSHAVFCRSGVLRCVFGADKAPGERRIAVQADTPESILNIPTYSPSQNVSFVYKQSDVHLPKPQTIKKRMILKLPKPLKTKLCGFR